MIKIESIFCLIKIHLTNNHLAPNFSRECKKMNKAQSLQCLSSAGTATIRPVMRGSHPEPFALEGTFSQTLKHRTFFFLPLDLVLWESFVKVQQPIEPEKLQWAEVHTSHRHPSPTPPGKRMGHWIQNYEAIPGWVWSAARRKTNCSFHSCPPQIT